MASSIVEAMKEARFWVVLVLTVLGTQGVSAIVVPEFAGNAAEKVETDVSKTVLNLAQANNNHADHIEALQNDLVTATRNHKTDLKAAQDEVQKLQAKLNSLNVTIEALILIHGERTVQRYVGRLAEPPPKDPTVDIFFEPLPAERVGLPKARRLPVNYQEIQQPLAE